MWAKDIMETNVVTIRKETPVKKIAELMLKHKISGLPVVDRLETCWASSASWT